MFELLMRVLCEVHPPAPVEGAYLFAQTADNERSVFETGLDLVNGHQARQLWIAGSAPVSGYPGFEAWRRKLLELGLDKVNLGGISIDSSSLNTLIEAKALVQYARINNVTALLLVASPFQQLRAFITTVSVLLREFPELRVYNRVGAALPWDETVVHSQGTLRCTRSELIQSEMERIERYRLKGDLAPTEKIFDYLKWRDR